MTKILFITVTHLGDGVLSTGALGWLAENHPNAEITVACGPVVEDIFNKAPGVKRVISMKKERRSGHWIKLWKQTIGTKWDIIVDLRNTAVSRLLYAKKKYVWSHADANRHKVEQVADVLGVSPPPAPKLWFDAKTLAEADRILPNGGGPVLAIGPTANWPGKEWPQENYAALVKKLTADNGILPAARLAVVAAPGEEERAWPVLRAVPEDRRIDAIAKGSPLLGAAVLSRCALYIGNDSGLMHTAAATGIPTLGIFGYGWPRLYRPWGERGAFVTTPETPEELIAPYNGDHSLVTGSLLSSLTVDAVHDAAVNLWNKTRS